MESYQTFLARVKGFEKAELVMEGSVFVANPNLKDKVADDGSFKTFYGDTVVFDLEEKDKEWLASRVETLYRDASDCFAAVLPISSYHMTLHDLSNGNQLSRLVEEMVENRQRLENQLQMAPLSPQIIRMKSHFIFNMVDTSLVLGLIPASRADYEILMELYRRVDAVKGLSYPFTPHITLAYFHPKGFGAAQIEVVKKVVAELNQSHAELFLDTSRLYYQTFRSMGDYQTVFSLLQNECQIEDGGDGSCLQ